MKTLLERLKPEVRAKLDEFGKDYPNNHAFVIKTLSEKSHTIDMTLWEYDVFGSMTETKSRIDFYESFE